MRLALKTHGVAAIDAVFSSEAYGSRLAAAFDAEHVLVDPARSAYPVSGTLCRDDLRAAWSNIIAPARQQMCTRIIVVGAESTGTTTLARALTDYYRPRFPRIADVPEFGRQYTYEKFDALRADKPDAMLEEMVWTAADFGLIGSRQNGMENAAADACPLVIADTDALATTLWERFYLGERSYGSFAAAASLPRRDLYLVTDHEGVDFEDDGWREGEHRRAEMTEWFKETLTEEGHSWILVTGDPDRRMRTAVEVIDAILARRHGFHLAAVGHPHRPGRSNGMNRTPNGEQEFLHAYTPEDYPSVALTRGPGGSRSGRGSAALGSGPPRCPPVYGRPRPARRVRWRPGVGRAGSLP